MHTKKTLAHAKVFSCYSILFFFGQCNVIVFFNDAAELFATCGAKKIFGIELAVKANGLTAGRALDLIVIGIITVVVIIVVEIVVIIILVVEIEVLLYCSEILIELLYGAIPDALSQLFDMLPEILIELLWGVLPDLFDIATNLVATLFELLGEQLPVFLQQLVDIVEWSFSCKEFTG